MNYKYDPILMMNVPEEGTKTQDASRGHEIIVKTENYLKSIGKNNSVGKYDKVVRGVKSLLEEGFLEGPELEKAIKQEADRLLKKYSLDSAIEATDAKDSSVNDFSASEAKSIFDSVDRRFTKDMNEYPRMIANAKTPDECERIEQSIRATLDDVVDEYIQIWNQVGQYAQKRKNDVVSRYGDLMRDAFKKYNELMRSK